MTQPFVSVILSGVMKRTIFYLTLLSGIFAGVMAPVAFADEDATPSTEQKVKKSKKSKKDKEDAQDEEDSSDATSVKAALKNVTFLTDDEPSTKAKYYIYLHSASWCGPCKALMPEIVKEYKKMKKKKVEVILIGHDKTADAAVAYLEHYKAGFPGVLSSAPETRSLPGITSPNGIPAATIVDKNGNVLYNGHGKGALEWKKYCKPAKKKK